MENKQVFSPTRTSTALLLGLRENGNRHAWGEFDRRYRPLILGLARRLGLPAADAEDAAQETMAAFLAAYRENRYQSGQGRLRDWLRGIAAHKIQDLRRQRARKEKPLSTDVGGDLLEQIPDDKIQAAWEEQCRQVVLRQALEMVRQQVAPQTFEAFRLYALEQWPAKQVAARLRISEDVIYQSKKRILERLRGFRQQLETLWWE